MNNLLFTNILIISLFFIFFNINNNVKADNYAVLVAGSNGYYNYRHQSDICHAFHVLTNSSKGSIPKENIIVMMYDDIANNEQNPIKGNIINHPNGPNVYPGVNKDYTGEDVTPDNFLKILAGNTTSSGGKVLKTTEKDNIFVYFADHGAPGLIAFPSSYLYAKDLMNTLKYMHQHKKYNQLVFYIEACESGSMFDNLLPDNMNIFATTAATPDQSSYACYYDSTRGTYLGDEYSVRWMEDSDVHDHSGSTWTLEQQYKLVASETKQSQPQQYGQTSISKSTIETFQGYNMKTNEEKRSHYPFTPTFTPCNDGVSSRDVKLQTLLNNKKMETNIDIKAKWQAEINAELVHRGKVDYLFENIVKNLVGPLLSDQIIQQRYELNDFNCYKTIISGIEQHCGKFSEYALKHFYILANMCSLQMDTNDIISAAAYTCENIGF